MIIIDDHAQLDEIMSTDQRGKINDWFGRTLVSRIDNKLTGRILIIMQRLHLEDLTGHVQRNGRWDVLTLPVEAEIEETIRLTSGRVHHRKPGEVLRPESEPREILAQTRLDMDSHAYSAQYQRRPIPTDGEIVKLEWFGTYDITPLPPYARIVQSWDTATKISGSTDYSVCITAAVVLDRVHVIDIFKARLDFPSLHRALINMARRFKAEVLIIENKGAGTSLRQQLLVERNHGVPEPIAFLPLLDKVTRMATVSPIVERGDVMLPKHAPWLKAFIDELLQCLFAASRLEPRSAASWTQDRDRANVRASQKMKIRRRRLGAAAPLGSSA